MKGCVCNVAATPFELKKIYIFRVRLVLVILTEHNLWSSCRISGHMNETYENEWTYTAKNICFIFYNFCMLAYNVLPLRHTHLGNVPAAISWDLGVVEPYHRSHQGGWVSRSKQSWYNAGPTWYTLTQYFNNTGTTRAVDRKIKQPLLDNI